MFNSKYWIATIFILGFILRLITSTIGYHGDLNNNISWGKVAYEKGLNGFYDGYKVPDTRSPYGSSNSDDWEYSAPNQPPLTIIVLAGMIFLEEKVSTLIWNLNDKISIFPSALVWYWESWGTILMVKLPSILADIGIGYIIYGYFRSQKKDELGIKLAAIWTFNPVIWYNSAVWGQTDSLVNILGLLSITFLIKKNLPVFAIFFALSFLFKGSLGIFIPLLFFYALFQKYRLNEWVKSIAYCLITITLISVWFYPQLDLFQWLYSLYTTRILPGEIGYLTANAFNFWWLIDPGKIYDSTVYFIFPARIWGFITTLIINGCVIYWFSRKPNDKRLFAALILVSLASFMFLTRIHERYLYPLFPIATLFLGLSRGFLSIYLFFSLVHLFNLYNMYWVPGIPFFENLLSLNWFTNTLAVVSLFLFVLTLRHLKRANI